MKKSKIPDGEYHLSLIQRIIMRMANITGLFVIPAEHLDAWDKEETQSQNLDEATAAKGRVINKIIMAIMEYHHYRRGRPNNKLLS